MARQARQNEEKAMWECKYAKEPFDLRLTVLRLLKRTPVIILITCLGTLIFGGGYYLKKVLLRPAPLYQAISTYYVNYGWDLEYDKDYAYINEASWNDWMHKKAFLNLVSANLQKEIPQEELSGYLSAILASNLRMPNSVVSTPDPELTLMIAEAVERSFVEFPSIALEIESIRVVDPAVDTTPVYEDARPVRALALSGVVSIFFALVCCLLWEIGSDAIWLPATLRRRYGLKTLGTVESPEFIQNLNYFFSGKNNIGICPASVELEPGAVARVLKDAEPGEATRGNKELRVWVPVPAPLLEPQAAERLRELDGILLVVRAGEHGRRLECILDFLDQQDCPVTAALLWEADERLIRQYYFLNRQEEVWRK